MDENKRTEEILQGQKISTKAEVVWGWGTPAGKKRAERRARYFIELGAIARGKMVLEIGCGTGFFTKIISAAGGEIYAVDISPDLLAVAKKNVNCPQVHFQTGDIHNLQFADHSFDAVIGSSVLHHLDLAQALREIRRVLKNGGRIVFTEPNMLNPQIMMERNIKPIGRLLGNTPNETAFTERGLSRDLRAAGFNGIEVLPFDFLHPWVPEFLIPFVERLGSVLEKLPLIRHIAGSLLITAKR